eukprot:GHUV01033165.1.p1 GENE.GHUV01033165.1~~GHUV01033165.1.p1  ORF type:complete len:328 (+),score=85.69 GHUV01033165.1:149-1132(+)
MMHAYGRQHGQLVRTPGRLMPSVSPPATTRCYPPAGGRSRAYNLVRCRSPSTAQRVAGSTEVQPAQATQHALLSQQASSVPEHTAVATTNHQAAYRAEDSEVHDEYIKIIGLGQRGISAASRLMGNKNMQGAEFWVLDSDSKVLSGSGASNTIHIPPEDVQDAQLSAADLRRLAGEAAVTAAVEAPRQRPGSPVPTTGVAFLLAGAGGIPGGSTLLLQIAAYLRRTGFFVVTAVTRPFEFEGRRKLEEADALIEALQDVAQLVVGFSRHGQLLQQYARSHACCAADTRQPLRRLAGPSQHVLTASSSGCMVHPCRPLSCAMCQQPPS